MCAYCTLRKTGGRCSDWNRSSPPNSNSAYRITSVGQFGVDWDGRRHLVALWSGPETSRSSPIHYRQAARSGNGQVTGNYRSKAPRPCFRSCGALKHKRILRPSSNILPSVTSNPPSTCTATSSVRYPNSRAIPKHGLPRQNAIAVPRPKA